MQHYILPCMILTVLLPLRVASGENDCTVAELSQSFDFVIFQDRSIASMSTAFGDFGIGEREVIEGTLPGWASEAVMNLESQRTVTVVLVADRETELPFSPLLILSLVVASGSAIILSVVYTCRLGLARCITQGRSEVSCDKESGLLRRVLMKWTDNRS